MLANVSCDAEDHNQILNVLLKAGRENVYQNYRQIVDLLACADEIEEQVYSLIRECEKEGMDLFGKAQFALCPACRKAKRSTMFTHAACCGVLHCAKCCAKLDFCSDP